MNLEEGLVEATERQKSSKVLLTTLLDNSKILLENRFILDELEKGGFALISSGNFFKKSNILKEGFDSSPLEEKRESYDILLPSGKILTQTYFAQIRHRSINLNSPIAHASIYEGAYITYLLTLDGIVD